MRWVEAAQLLLGQVRKVEVARRHEVAREDADLKCNKLGLNEIQFALKFGFGAIIYLSVALAGPPPLVAGDLVVLGEHLDHVALRETKLVLTLGLESEEGGTVLAECCEC